MSKVLRFFVVLSWLGTAFVSAMAQNEAESPRKKLIELGWDIPSTQFLKENWREMEAETPFDGVIYHLSPPGKISSQALWDAQPWNRDDYAVCVDDLKSCDFRQFMDNFIRVNFTPANVRWDDDEAWKTIAEKVGICAWVSRESGSKGLAPDFESYGERLFRYRSQDGLTWEETKNLAFQRGEEFVRAVAEYQPDAVILCLWMNSINFAAGRATDPDSRLVASDYGLLPSFVNGMINAAPSETIFVDGCENGYYYNSNEDYQRAALEMILWTGSAVNLVPPELKAKYRRQVQAGFGFYLDMFSNPEGNVFYRGPKEGGTRMDRLCDNLRSAWNASDQYVWVYGEQNRWWGVPENDPKIKSWETALPDLTENLWLIKDPRLGARKVYERIRQNPPTDQLLKNADFSVGTLESTPENWGSWQIENAPSGELVWSDEDGGRAWASNVSNGCFIQSVENVAPGSRYYFRVRVRTNRPNSASVRLRWQTAEGSWIHDDLDPILTVDSKTTQENKTTESDVSLENDEFVIEGLAEVPSGVGKIVVLLSASGQEGDDWITFDDAELYLIR